MASSSACSWLTQTLGRPDSEAVYAVPQPLAGPLPTGVSGAKLRALLPYFEQQKTDASCSLASCALVLNAMRAQLGLPRLSQEALLAQESTGMWARATANDGDGIDLDTLRYLVLRAATALRGGSHGPGAVVDVVHVPNAQASQQQQDEARRNLAYVLARGEALADDFFVVINVLQSRMFARGADVGHMSVVGAYDEQRERVLILDVDNLEGLLPYWVSLDALLQAMQTIDVVTGETRGYLVLRSGR